MDKDSKEFITSLDSLTTDEIKEYSKKSTGVITGLGNYTGEQIADLASASHRNPSAVSRDVSKLSALGLLKVESVSNEGHGRKKIVMPVASTLSIHASIAAT